MYLSGLINNSTKGSADCLLTWSCQSEILQPGFMLKFESVKNIAFWVNKSKSKFYLQNPSFVCPLKIWSPILKQCYTPPHRFEILMPSSFLRKLVGFTVPIQEVQQWNKKQPWWVFVLPINNWFHNLKDPIFKKSPEKSVYNQLFSWAVP